MIGSFDLVSTGRAEGKLWIVDSRVAKSLCADVLPAVDEFVALNFGGNWKSFKVLAQVIPVDAVENLVIPFSGPFDVLSRREGINV